jgi:hypothetical protein
MAFELEEFLYYIFGVPSKWVNFPDIIFYFLIPLSLLVAIYYVFLEKGLKVLPTGANIGLSIVIGILTSRLIVFLIPGMLGTVVLAIALAGICALFYRSAIEVTLGILWAILFVLWLGGPEFLDLWEQVIDLSLIFILFGFFGVIAFFTWILKMARVSILIVIVVLMVLTLVLPLVIRIG